MPYVYLALAICAGVSSGIGISVWLFVSALSGGIDADNRTSVVPAELIGTRRG